MMGIFYISLVLLLRISNFAFSGVVNIAGIFPLENLSDENINLGQQYLAAFLMAIKEINNKHDGILDKLLPNTTLKYAVKSSDGTALDSILQAIDLDSKAFNYSGIAACIGASTNTESNAIAQVFNAFKTVQISYSSTASYLSYAAPYPYFYRTCTSEAAQSLAMANMVHSYFGWRKVSVFSTTDSYGSDGNYAFINAATSLGIQILSSHNFQSGQKDMTVLINAAKETGARIFILFMSSSDATRLMEQGYTMGLFYPGTQILGSSIMTVPSTWENMSKSVDVDAVMSGFIGFIPAFGLNITYTQSFVNRWRAQKDTKKILSDGTIVCDTSLDDNGKPLYQHGSQCAGLSFSSFAKDGSDIASYVPHTYDATYALAHALHTLIYDMGISTFTGDELGEVLQFNTSFQGEIGLVSFRYGDPATGYGFGDRLHDFSFNVMNYRKSSSSSSSSGGSLQSVGLWTEGKGFQQCSSQSCLIEFSTTDGTIPIDTPLPVIDLMPLVVRIVLMIMSVICLAVVVGFTVFIVIHRTKKLIKAAQPKILMFTLFGGLLGCFRVGNAAIDVSDSTCTSGAWLGHLAFVLVMTSLLAKLWRVSRVVRSGFKRVVVGESYIIKAILVVVSIACVYLVLFTAIGQPHVVDDIVYLSQQRTKIRHKCTMKHSQFALALYICECLSLVYAWYLCWATKNVPDGINEAKHIALSTYIIIFICIIVFPTTLLLSLSPTMNQVIISTGFAIAICACMTVLLGHKAILVFEGADLNNNMRLVHPNSSVADSGPMPSSMAASSRFAENNNSSAALSGARGGSGGGGGLDNSNQQNNEDFPSPSEHKITDNSLARFFNLHESKKRRLIWKKVALEQQLKNCMEELHLLDPSASYNKSQHGHGHHGGGGSISGKSHHGTSISGKSQHGHGHGGLSMRTSHHGPTDRDHSTSIRVKVFAHEGGSKVDGTGASTTTGSGTLSENHHTRQDVVSETRMSAFNISRVNKEDWSENGRSNKWTCDPVSTFEDTNKNQERDHINPNGSSSTSNHVNSDSLFTKSDKSFHSTHLVRNVGSLKMLKENEVT